MKKLLVSHKNIKAGFYTAVVLVQASDKEVLKEMYARELKSLDPAKLNDIRDIETYLIGIFDDSTGSITLCEKELLIATNDYVSN